MGNTGKAVGTAAGAGVGFAVGGPVGAVGGGLVGGAAGALMDGSGGPTGFLPPAVTGPSEEELLKSQIDAKAGMNGVLTNAHQQNRDQNALGERYNALGDRYQGIINGSVVTPAQLQAQAGMQMQRQNAASLAASTRGGGGNALIASRQAQTVNATGSQDVNRQSGILRAQESQAAMAGYGGMLSQQGGMLAQQRQGNLNEAQLQANREIAFLSERDSQAGRVQQGNLAALGAGNDGNIASQNRQYGLAGAGMSAGATVIASGAGGGGGGGGGGGQYFQSSQGGGPPTDPNQYSNG